ncbi:MAG: phospholipase D-like domain-containing protein [Myxococcota bacterium]|jgi:phosphatidylserine/phosphatidylglycerophosphate/cardiolipin synthase-like enzyme|nr:phospholipase D-like domain-containing protein [Myxococcota bacterium]
MKTNGLLGLLALVVLFGCAEEPQQQALGLDDGIYIEGEEAAPQAQGKADGAGAYSKAFDALPAGINEDAPLIALFAPDDPVITLELEQTDKVIAARKADPRDYAEGENPYRVRYAVYDLKNELIVEKLIEAQNAGVDVQILIESTMLASSKRYHKSDERLVEAGFELATDHKKLSGDAYKTVDLVGIRRTGYMHLKLRLFETPERDWLLTGSFNPGDHAPFNDETLHLINDPTLVRRYQAMYDGVLREELVDNPWDESAAVNVLFTPEASGVRAGAKLLEWLQQENEQILLMVFALRDITAPGFDQGLIDLLYFKAKAGVPVYVITDKKQTYYDSGATDILRNGGVHVYEVTNTSTRYTAMHHKVAILGREHIRVITDTANWSKGALGSVDTPASYHESVLFIDTERLDQGYTGRRYLSQFVRVLERYAFYGEQDRQPSARSAIAELSGHGDWPTQATRFVGWDIYTTVGQEAFVTGELEVLGAWGANNLGLPMSTDASTYPTWRSSSVELPLGVPFDWKLTSGDPRSTDLTWEPRTNRTDRALAPAFSEDDVAEIHGSWGR